MVDGEIRTAIWDNGETESDPEYEWDTFNFEEDIVPVLITADHAGENFIFAFGNPNGTLSDVAIMVTQLAVDRSRTYTVRGSAA